jgi:superfamily II DNA helicase RecQ
MRNGGEFERMWNKRQVFRRLLYFVFDEAHCILLWEHFRNSYGLLGRLRLLTPDRIPIYAPTATATPPAIKAIKTSLQLRESETVEILRSNDRADLHIAARFMQHPAYTFKDLAFLIPDPATTTALPPCFLVFCSSQETTEEACLTLEAMAPFMKGKIAWFHSDMTPECRAEMLDKLRSHELWGLFCTDAFGLVCTKLSAHHLDLTLSAGVERERDSHRRAVGHITAGFVNTLAAARARCTRC